MVPGVLPNFQPKKQPLGANGCLKLNLIQTALLKDTSLDLLYLGAGKNLAKIMLKPLPLWQR